MDWNDKEQVKEYKKKRYQDNKDLSKEVSKKYRENNPNAWKEWAEKNKESLKEYRKKYRQENLDKMKKYYKDNKTQLQEYAKAYREKNRTKEKRVFLTKEEKESLILISINSNKWLTLKPENLSHIKFSKLLIDLYKKSNVKPTSFTLKIPSAKGLKRINFLSNEWRDLRPQGLGDSTFAEFLLDLYEKTLTKN